MILLLYATICVHIDLIWYYMCICQSQTLLLNNLCQTVMFIAAPAVLLIMWNRFQARTFHDFESVGLETTCRSYAGDSECGIRMLTILPDLQHEVGINDSRKPQKQANVCDSEDLIEEILMPRIWIPFTSVKLFRTLIFSPGDPDSSPEYR